MVHLTRHPSLSYLLTKLHSNRWVSLTVLGFVLVQWTSSAFAFTLSVSHRTTSPTLSRVTLPTFWHPSPRTVEIVTLSQWIPLFSSATSSPQTVSEHPFIDVDLRNAAMKLHTRSQAPKEGQAMEATPRPTQPYVPTHMDYLQFLVDSQHVYKALEDIVHWPHLQPDLTPFQQTGLERVDALEQDIEYMKRTFQLTRPPVGSAGLEYAQFLYGLVSTQDATTHPSQAPYQVPKFMCHYYNFYFAHTAGGRMIGKQMAALLLNKVTLEFYQWKAGDLNLLKKQVKDRMEQLAQSWGDDQKMACVNETAMAFRGGGAINTYLSGGASASGGSGH